jgi:hypothetical protein
MYPYNITSTSKLVDISDGYDETFWELYEDHIKIFDQTEDIPCEYNPCEDKSSEDSQDCESVVEDEEDPPEPKDIFTCCSKCKETKSMLEFHESHPTVCKNCRLLDYEHWLANNPNAKLAEDLRVSIRKKENIEKLTGLPSKMFDEWMAHTKEFFIPSDYQGQIDIEHLYPLCQYDLSNDEDVKHCFHWKHVRYTTHEYNLKKGRRMPTAEEIEEQNTITELFLKKQS